MPVCLYLDFNSEIGSCGKRIRFFDIILKILPMYTLDSVAMWSVLVMFSALLEIHYILATARDGLISEDRNGDGGHSRSEEQSPDSAPSSALAKITTADLNWNEPPFPCSERCHCYASLKHGATMNCWHLDYDDLPPVIYRNLSRLRLDYNHITNLSRRGMDTARSVYQLSISNNNITEMDETAFADMTNLKELNLKFNPLMTLPDWVFSPLLRLTSFQLSNIGLQEFNSRAFVNLTNLVYLDLTDNVLKKMPRFVWNGAALMPNLQYLHLEGNAIVSFHASELRGYESVVELHLTGNHIKTLEADNFFLMRSMNRLVLDKNFPFDDIDKCAFCQAARLQTISLANSGFTVTRETASIFQRVPNIRKLSLSNIHISNKMKPDVDVVFQNLRRLMELDLTGVDLGSKIQSGMLANLTSLKWLRLSSTKIGTYLRGDVFVDVGDTLEQLDLADNKLVTVNRSSLPEKLWRRLRRIDLSANPFTCDCNLVWFRRWLKTNSSILHIGALFLPTITDHIVCRTTVFHFTHGVYVTWTIYLSISLFKN